MERPSIERLEALFALLSKHGVTRYREGDVEVEMLGAAAVEATGSAESLEFEWERRPGGRRPTEAEIEDRRRLHGVPE